MILNVKAKDHSYNVVIEKGCLAKAKEHFKLDRKVMIVTDSNIPKEYIDTVFTQCKEAHVFTFKAGEKSKNFDTYKSILMSLFENKFSRRDCVVAIGGGVSGDMAGFAAATYMRGIDFYNIPTTVLSMVDSSIGGKTAIDLDGVKNIVGAFYAPMGVLVDVDVLKTLPEREVNAGLVESIKMSLTCDANLFDFISKQKDLMENIETIVTRSLEIKKHVVELDETEHSVRQILNFGHTVGHAIETHEQGKLLHGECVGLGMVAVTKGEVKEKIVKILKKYNLPYEYNIDKNELIALIAHDKKASESFVNLIKVESIGDYVIDRIKISDMEALL
ncbi:MAG: 3-dehydroquinate synthase [Bacilli bacterium]|nr:3-dehydroquinate synthase [Bacilli bacterium]